MTEVETGTQPSVAEQSNRVSSVIGVMSGKGGVGKSLVTAFLACALRESGGEVGILDADITGPSIPKMFGITSRPETSDLGISPVVTRTGIRAMSINLFLNAPDDAVIWRGPMISNAVQQFWKDVFWGKLDYLIVDLPPGTADVPLTVMQALPLDCVTIVCSPQDLAAMVVRKAVNMCRKMEVPILGLVQNMTSLRCPECGKVIYPFGKSDSELLAREMNVPHILDVPLDPAISALADAGAIEDYTENPFVAAVPKIVNGIMKIKNLRGDTPGNAPDSAG